MPKCTTRKRAAISLETKKALCQYKLEHPSNSAKRLIEIFNLDVDRSTVSKILVGSDRWIKKNTSGDSGQLTKERKDIFSKVNDSLGEWVSGALATNRILTGKILQTKALDFAQRFPEESHFKASDGWLEKFKKRHNLHHIKMHGEANSAPLEILSEERERLRAIIGEYDLNDVYNADETALFFRMPPNATLATRPTSGTKRDKSRITVLLACSATGNTKLQPLVIGKAASPRCFRNINMNALPCTYRHNTKAWMRRDIFGEWLDSLNTEMGRKKKDFIVA
jgi:DDE superfamily endonuclease/Tc5 transposase DNA-binding domain